MASVRQGGIPSRRGAEPGAPARRGAAEQGKSPDGGARRSLPHRIRKKFRVFSVRSGLDMPFLFLVLVLLVTGLVMMFSSSYAYAYYNYGDSYYFILRQAVYAAIGVTIMLAVSYFDYHHLHKFAIPALMVSFILLGAVLVLPASDGVHRWIDLGFINFQPSEITKFAIILSFAHLISLNFKRMDTFRYGVLPYLLILGATCALLVLEPHISATVIVILLGGVMLFIGGVKFRWFGAAAALAVAAVLYLVVFTQEFTYANNRLEAWLDPFNVEIRDLTWQTRQSMMAIGSGGLLGLGLGQSRQKYLYLPEPQNDFIFAIVCEELGFIGALIIILLFVLLVWRGVTISLKAKDKFGMLLGVGLTLQVGIQVVLNIAVVTNTIPNTGISLPFFSSGGTSLIMLLAQMGVVLSISRTSAIDKT